MNADFRRFSRAAYISAACINKSISFLRTQRYTKVIKRWTKAQNKGFSNRLYRQLHSALKGAGQHTSVFE